MIGLLSILLIILVIVNTATILFLIDGYYSEVYGEKNTLRKHIAELAAELYEGCNWFGYIYTSLLITAIIPAVLICILFSYLGSALTFLWKLGRK